MKNNKKKINIIFESPKNWHKWLMKKHIGQGLKVFVIEPFHAYHHEEKIRFYPRELPGYVYDFVKSGQVTLLKAEDFDAKGIYLRAADKSVEVCDKVFSEYKKEHRCIIRYACDTLGSHVAENIFRKYLCDRLAVFYSVNNVLEKIAKISPQSHMEVYPDTNILSYLYLKKLLINSGQKVFEGRDFSFSSIEYFLGFLEIAKNNFIAISRLCAQTILSGLLSSWRVKNLRCKEYKYGITIIGPARQLANNRRGPDFFVDGEIISGKEVVYFPLTKLNDKQKQQLSRIDGDVFYPPSRRFQNFSHFLKWVGLLGNSFSKGFLVSGDVVTYAHLALSEYFRWGKVVAKTKIKNFITHCDFGISHIPRNLALNQAGVKTWYFIDSMNVSINSKHPFWSYLYYDNFITWDRVLGEYFCSYPDSINKYNVVGCLWSAHINDREKKQNNKLIVSVFDTTYSCNSFTSYQEGIVYAEHILKLAEGFPDIQILFKEKNARLIHRCLDSILAPRLVSLYLEMERCPNIKIFSEGEDSSRIMSISDMVVSFPFTSTTFEALSVNKPAIWHDPVGYYRKTLYGKVGGVVTHSYEELKAKVLEIKKNPDDYHNPIPMNSPLMDPCRDRKAITRFRELLAKS